ncbi:ubiquinol-cytochrome c reductase iron-sulfur subunit [Sphaerotilus sp.]|uniref:ubiquinol-cytochrome c reductase iron-sulfur subunit n=1 Tax=Sphaerotilus sp. TaxID=2093942 RepID=UPI0034E2DF7B
MNTTTLSTALPLSADTTDPERRTWLLAAGSMGAAAVLTTAVPLVSTLAPSERARAMGAPVEVDIADLRPGELRTAEWRGKPVWVLRRTPDMLAGLAPLASQLADPDSRRDQQPAYATNVQRSIRPDVLVVVGICTHLGCSPSAVPQGSANASVGDHWPGGFLCPCHGSTFDLAGRVFKNKPAPTNLEVPPHRYAGDTRLLIGEDSAT